MEGGFNIINQGGSPVVVSGMDSVGNVWASGTVTCGNILTTGTATGTFTGTQAFNGMIDANAGYNSASGVIVLGGGTIGAGGAAIVGTAATGTQLSDVTRDYNVYIGVTAGGTAATLTIGPANTCVNTLYAAATCNVGTQYSFRLPAGWFIRFQGTAGITQQIAISC